MATASPSSASEDSSRVGPARIESSRVGSSPVGSEPIRPSTAPSDVRGQAPTTALVAVAMLGLAVSLYATVLGGAAPAPERNLAVPTLDRAHDVLAPAEVASPTRLDEATDAGPAGYAVNASLVADGERWSVGPKASESADVASRRVAVRTNETTVAPGRLRVAVWR